MQRTEATGQAGVYFGPTGLVSLLESILILQKTSRWQATTVLLDCTRPGPQQGCPRGRKRTSFIPLYSHNRHVSLAPFVCHAHNHHRIPNWHQAIEKGESNPHWINHSNPTVSQLRNHHCQCSSGALNLSPETSAIWLLRVLDFVQGRNGFSWFKHSITNDLRFFKNSVTVRLRIQAPCVGFSSC